MLIPSASKYFDKYFKLNLSPLDGCLVGYGEMKAKWMREKKTFPGHDENLSYNNGMPFKMIS